MAMIAITTSNSMRVNARRASEGLMALPGDDQSRINGAQHNAIATKRFTSRLPSLVVIASLETEFNVEAVIISENPSIRYTDSDSMGVDELGSENRE